MANGYITADGLVLVGAPTTGQLVGFDAATPPNAVPVDAPAGGPVQTVTTGTGLTLTGEALGFDGSLYDAAGAATTAATAAQANAEASAATTYLPLAGGTVGPVTFATSATLDGVTITTWPTGNAPGGSSGQIQTNNGDGTFGATTAVTVSGSDTTLAGNLTNSGGSGVTWDLGGGVLAGVREATFGGDAVIIGLTNLVFSNGENLYAQGGNVLVQANLLMGDHTLDLAGNALRFNGTAAEVTSDGSGNVTATAASWTFDGSGNVSIGGNLDLQGNSLIIDTGMMISTSYTDLVLTAPRNIQMNATVNSGDGFYGHFFQQNNGNWLIDAIGNATLGGYLTLAPLDTGTTAGTVDGQIVRDSTTGSLAIWQAGTSEWTVLT